MKKNNLHVLTVDDSRASRMVTRKYMTDLGFQVTEAGDVSEGVACLKKGVKYDLLLVDSDVRGMSGLDFVREARSEPVGKEVPIILMSQQSSQDRMVAAIEAGANEYIIKPFTKEALEAKLELLGIEYR